MEGIALSSIFYNKRLMYIVAIVVGLVIWFVIPILTDDRIKKKSNRKAVGMLCRIIGIAVIALAALGYLYRVLLA